jgi:hypothetical protein
MGFQSVSLLLLQLLEREVGGDLWEYLEDRLAAQIGFVSRHSVFS